MCKESSYTTLFMCAFMRFVGLKSHKIEIYFGFDFEICIISLSVMSTY
jgi:hypothetical protein